MIETRRVEGHDRGGELSWVSKMNTQPINRAIVIW